MMNGQEQDCAICLQKCHHPTKLPCGHIFCFLCVKGVAIQSKRCPMCRGAIPSDYLDHPVLLDKILEQQTSQGLNEHYQWYYEGRNGWWKYDERSNTELEAAFSAEEADCSLLLAGAVYTINFQSMVQVRRNDPTRRRRVRRDTPALPAKGIAGIKNLDIRPLEPIESSNDDNSNDVTSIPEEDEIIVIEDDDATNESIDSDSSDDIVRVLSTISLMEPESLSDPPTESPDETYVTENIVNNII